MHAVGNKSRGMRMGRRPQTRVFLGACKAVLADGAVSQRAVLGHTLLVSAEALNLVRECAAFLGTCLAVLAALGLGAGHAGSDVD